MSNAEMSPGVFTEEISGPIYDNFFKNQKSSNQGFVRFQPYNQVLPKCYENFEKKVKDFQIREDDVWISSFPKCGKANNCTFKQISN